ncbi:hypothetical protein AVEN_44853-1 [Araneus ventricosus]|uniref:Uncharacterized protein n=1 Tax=Araneus ventricosus TaxID=182803 RepID=A0A4Y2CJX5_ARAVE|nr:hypothetical protein AVEN_44853-1 [Araneus ventricosus]
MVRSRLRDGRVSGSKSDSTGDLPCMWAWCTQNLTSCVKRPLTGVLRKFGEGVSTQVSSSSSAHGSKLRSLFQNNLRVALKRDVNITKLNLIIFLLSQCMFKYFVVDQERL